MAAPIQRANFWGAKLTPQKLTNRRGEKLTLGMNQYSIGEHEHDMCVTLCVLRFLLIKSQHTFVLDNWGVLTGKFRKTIHE